MTDLISIGAAECGRRVDPCGVGGATPVELWDHPAAP